MYKIIYNDNVIDVVKDLKYLRYLEKSNHYVTTDSSSANCIQGSNDVVYWLQGTKFPVTIEHKIVIVKKINKQEYDKLCVLLNENEVVYGDSVELIQTRNDKIQELKEQCAYTIKNGISIKLLDGKFHQFELTIEDQLNLNILKTILEQAAKFIIYHEKGCTCKLYDSEDIKTIIYEANKHIEYNTTYFNFMRQCINNINDINVIKNIHYGDKLPNEDYDRLLQSL